MTEISEQITACSFSKVDLETLCRTLQESSNEAADEEVNHYIPIDRDPEKIASDIASLREGYRIKVTVQGMDDERIHGTIPAVFDSPRFPDRVKRLYINSALELKNSYNWTPRNHFELLLDFTKPEFFNLPLSPSASTPNASNFLVTGLNSTWVNGVYHAVKGFVKNRKTRRQFFHRHSVYDLLLLCGGLPFAFGISYKLSRWINTVFGEISGVLQGAAYVYVFYFSLILFRILFDYGRWVFPIVEYIESTNIALKHRVFLATLAMAVVGNFVYDMFKIATALIP